MMESFTGKSVKGKWYILREALRVKAVQGQIASLSRQRSALSSHGSYFGRRTVFRKGVRDFGTGSRKIDIDSKEKK